MSRLVTIGEAARELGVSPKTLRRYEARGLIKSIRTMGGQRRYYMSSLEDFLASAEDEIGDADKVHLSETNKPQTPPAPAPRSSTAWEAVDNERAALEALKVRIERDALLSARERDRARMLEEEQAKAERHRPEATRREEEAQQLVARADAEREHEVNLNLQIALSEVWIAQEPEEAHSALRRALAQLLTPANTPVGTPPHHLQQQVRDQIESVAEPFRRVQDLRKRGIEYVDRRLATFRLGYSERRKIRDLIAEELLEQVAKDWSTRTVECLVETLIDESVSLEEDDDH